MWAVLLPLIGELVVDGVKTWKEERRTRFLDQHFEILTKLNKLKSVPTDSYRYTDSAIDVSERELIIFLTSYKKELEIEESEHNISTTDRS